MGSKAMVQCFLDTEFTDLLNPQLLSLALVDHAFHEHYVELDMQCPEGLDRYKASSEFVRGHEVLGQFGKRPAAKATYWEMGRRTGEWLLAQAEACGSKVEVCFDYSADWDLLVEAVRNAGLWDRVREVVVPTDVDPLTGSRWGEIAAEQCYQQMALRDLRRHHAVADAYALQWGYMAARSATAGGDRRKAACGYLLQLVQQAHQAQGRDFAEGRFWVSLVTPCRALLGRKPIHVFDEPGGLDLLKAEWALRERRQRTGGRDT